MDVKRNWVTFTKISPTLVFRDCMYLLLKCYVCLDQHMLVRKIVQMKKFIVRPQPNV